MSLARFLLVPIALSCAVGPVFAEDAEPPQMVRLAPQQIVKPRPGEVVRLLPGQAVSLLPGQLQRPLPGGIVGALPGQIIGSLPGQLRKRQRGGPLQLGAPIRPIVRPEASAR